VADVDRYPLTEAQWEAAWAPYDQATYEAALELIAPDDIVLDIGAGDLRFARRAAGRARAVFAIEQRAELLTPPHRPNLTIICGDALAVPFPPGITVGVLLMRHCRHFRDFVAKLRSIGCARLITNARWRMGVEQIEFTTPRVPIQDLDAGWYACLCGDSGFVAASPEAINSQALDRVTGVASCPRCRESPAFSFLSKSSPSERHDPAAY
jgi:hypothetical protein